MMFSFNRKIQGKRDGAWSLLTPTAKLTAPKHAARKLAELRGAAEAQRYLAKRSAR